VSDRVRFHPRAQIDKLLDWCETNAARNAPAVAAIGLAFLWGLNEHQIAATRLVSKLTLTLAYPQARRRLEIAAAARAEIEVASVTWMAEAVGHLAKKICDGKLLYQPGNRMQIPAPAKRIRQLVQCAAGEATGMEMTVRTLASSRVVAAQELGTPLALFGTGYAPSYAARLAVARPALILSRKAQ
jgi:hypothetical protein